MIRLALISVLVAAAVSAIVYGAFRFLYIPITIHNLEARADELSSFGFIAHVYYGPEAVWPGIAVGVPYEWKGGATPFQNPRLYSDVITIAAQGQWMTREIPTLMSQMPRLQELYLDQQPVSDDDLAVFANNQNMKVLRLFWTNIGTRSLQTISSMQNLRELDLRDVKIDPAPAPASFPSPAAAWHRVVGSEMIPPSSPFLARSMSDVRE